MFELKWENLPNLQLIGERFYLNIFENINRKIKENQEIILAQTTANPDVYLNKPEPLTVPSFELLGVNYQTWPNNLGLKDDGESAVLDAMSGYFTTVMYERLTDIYGIFQNNELAYLVEGSSPNLLEDISNNNIKCLKIAKDRYSNFIKEENED